MKRIIISLLSGMITHLSIAYSDQCSVTITILDQDAAELTGAYVEVSSIALKAVSDINGEVTFLLDQGKVYTINIHSVGFETLNRSITIPFSKSYRYSFELNESTTELEEVVIKGQSSEERILNQPHKAEFLNLDNIRSQPVEVVSIINQMPGMRIRQNGGAGSEVDISINGIGGKGVKVFIDEIPVYLLGAGYAINTISQGVIENIEVYKGTIPVKFGSDALGGVINIKTRQKNSDYLDLSYSYGSWNTHQTTLSVNKRFGKNQRFSIGVEGFQTYADNDYWMDDVDIVIDDLNNTEKGRARRFNDAFDSKLGRITLGARNLSWADEIQVFSSLSSVDREWQHGITAETPWGEPDSEEDSWSTAFSWKKFAGNDKWDISLSAGYIVNKLNFVDTARKIYFWDQNFVPKTLAGESGIFGNGTTPEVNTDTYFARQNFNYAVSKQHNLNLTLLYSKDALSASNPAFSQEDQEGLGEPQDLIKNYTGLALESRMLGSRLTNIVSVKHFYQRSKAISFEFDEVGPLEENTYSLFGYGDVIRYQITTNIVANLGYEFTIRQPDSDELFGDFIRIIPNPDLQAEESHNINAGLEWKDAEGKFNAGASFFYRNTSNKVFLVVANRASSQYKNISQVETNGIEINADYQLIDGLKIFFNGTYQNAIARDLDTNEGFSASSIGERIPNEPYLFANFITDYSIPQLPISRGEIKLRYSFNYVHSFLASWDQDAKQQANTPTQKIHNLSAVWLAPEERWSLGVECRNLSDARAFDNFNVQRPGRSIYVKARLFLEKL